MAVKLLRSEISQLIVLSILLLFNSVSPQPGNTDFLSLLSSIQNMISPENNVMDVVSNFLDKQDFQVDKIKQYIDMFSAFTQFKGGDKIKELIDNPMAMMGLIQRLTVEWKQIEELLESPKVNGRALKKLSELISGSSSPSDEQLDEAASIVVRLQDVYGLKVKDIAKGQLGEFDTEIPLAASECFRLGKQAMINLDVDLAIIWFDKGIRLASKEKNKKLKLSYLRIDYLKQLLPVLKNSMKLATPEMLQSLSSIPGIPTESFHHLIARSDDNNPDTKLYKTYKKLCSGEQLQPINNLHCMFIPHDITGELQRVKAEYLSHIPLVTILHDVVTEKEMKKIKELATPNLEKVKVHKYDNNDDIRASTVRTGKSAWVSSTSDDIIARLYGRVEDFTGLSTANAEPLHVVHYGMGGHYEVHTDFFDLYSKKSNIVNSDRVATLLIYLNDVQSGGHTVFPQLSLSIKPEKGSAVFWFNLRRSGKGDMRTIHAACPVLSSSKWVADMWLSEDDQIFHRPCGLIKEQE